MTTISLDISGKIDPGTVEVFAAVSHVMTALKMPYIVVGAAARDLVLHHGHGAEIRRATEDIDFAMEVPDWNAFNVLKNKLIEQGFRETRAQHRLISLTDTVVDIVPFGDIENKQNTIVWPPTGEVIMNVAGFKEACEHAEWVRVQSAPEIDIPVVTPVGMSLLKIISWTDRAADLRNKDAKDIAYLLTSYEVIPEVNNRLYADTQILQTYGWDLTQAAACLLGQRARDIANKNTVAVIEALVNEEPGKLNFDLLAEEMCSHIENEFDRKLQLLSAFLDGFNYKD